MALQSEPVDSVTLFIIGRRRKPRDLCANSVALSLLSVLYCERDFFETSYRLTCSKQTQASERDRKEQSYLSCTLQSYLAHF